MKTNIVLIGLMGVGKTTLGKKLSELLGMDFVDVDEEIEKQYGSIKSLFEKGENYFRDIESKMVETLSEHNHLIISTGGGVVLRASNMRALKKKGIILYLKRSIEDIILSVDIESRPLLKNGTEILYTLNSEREPLYQSLSDYTIDASDIDQATQSVALLWKKQS